MYGLLLLFLSSKKLTFRVGSGFSALTLLIGADVSKMLTTKIQGVFLRKSNKIENKLETEYRWIH